MSAAHGELNEWLARMRREWLVRICVVGSLVFAGGAALQLWWYGVPLAGWVLGAGSVALLALGGVAWLTDRAIVVFRAVGGVVVATIAGVSFARGGFHLVLMLYLLVLPLGALMLRRRRSAPWWLGIVTAVALGLYVVEQLGLTPPRIPPDPLTDIVGALVLLGALTAAGYHGVGNLESRETAAAAYERELARQRRLELLGRLAGGIAHDFNNLLAIIQASAEDTSEGGWHTSRDTILAAVARGSGLTRNLLAAAHDRPEPRRVLDASATVVSTASLLTRVLPETVDLEVVAPRETYVEVDERELGHAVLNLCLNARDAMRAGGRLTVRCEELSLEGDLPEVLHGEVRPGRYARLTVSDEGVGMDAPTMARALEPFETTKDEGTGLGLHRVRRFVLDLDGAIALRSKPGEGTVVELYLPAVEAPARAVMDTSERESTAMRARGLRVLLVEDEAGVRRAMTRMLRSAGLAVTAAEDPRRAIALAKASPFDAVLSDVLMPQMSGPRLISALQAAGFDGRVVLMTGYAQSELEGVEHPVLQKPVAKEALLAALLGPGDDPTEVEAPARVAQG